MAIELYTNISLETTPVDPKHLVPMSWVEDFVAGKVKAPVRVVATANQAGTYAAAPAMTFTYTATGPTTIDGVALAVNDRVLFVGQTTATHNGIYTVTTVGAGATHTILTRATDFHQSNQIFSGVTIGVNQGDDHSHTFWRLATDDPITLDTSPLNFISVTPPIATRKYSETITGDGTETDFDVDHQLGTEDVHVQIFNNATKAWVMTGVTVEDADTVTIHFDVAPTAAQVFNVVVIG